MSENDIFSCLDINRNLENYTRNTTSYSNSSNILMIKRGTTYSSSNLVLHQAHLQSSRPTEFKTLYYIFFHKSIIFISPSLILLHPLPLFSYLPRIRSPQVPHLLVCPLSSSAPSPLPSSPPAIFTLDSAIWGKVRYE